MDTTKILFLFLFSFILFSCQDDGDIPNNLTSEEQKELIIDEVLQSAVLDDLLQDIDTYSLFAEGLKSAETGGCPEVTIQRPGSAPFWPQTITLDFGEGCEKFSKIKSGKMMIEKSGPWYEAGSVRRVTFENFVVDGMSIDGVKEIENITAGIGNPTFAIGAELEMEWAKNDTLIVSVSRVINKTQEWVFGFMDKDVKSQIILNGEEEIVRTVNGEQKTIEKKYNDISIVFGCRFPQSGVSEFNVLTSDGLKLDFTLDYGAEGEAGEKCSEDCDCLATLTLDDGTSEDIDLSNRWWKQASNQKATE
jgi:hypothetical protein